MVVELADDVGYDVDMVLDVDDVIVVELLANVDVEDDVILVTDVGDGVDVVDLTVGDVNTYDVGDDVRVVELTADDAVELGDVGDDVIVVEEGEDDVIIL